MNTPIPFTGFPKQALTFFRDLSQNNSKTWFDQHKEIYEQQVTGSGQGFYPGHG